MDTQTGQKCVHNEMEFDRFLKSKGIETFRNKKKGLEKRKNGTLVHGEMPNV